MKKFIDCPKCHKNHVDVNDWAVTPHHKHLCHYCGHKWRLDRFIYGCAEDDKQLMFAKGFDRAREYFKSQISIAKAIDKLREKEGNSVEIVYSNPDFNGSNETIIVVEDFANVVKEYTGDTLLDVFQKAVEDKL